MLSSGSCSGTCTMSVMVYIKTVVHSHVSSLWNSNGSTTSYNKLLRQLSTLSSASESVAEDVQIEHKEVLFFVLRVLWQIFTVRSATEGRHYGMSSRMASRQGWRPGTETSEGVECVSLVCETTHDPGWLSLISCYFHWYTVSGKIVFQSRTVTE